MFGSGDNTQLEYLWLDKKLHKVKINDGTNDIDLQQIDKAYTKMLEDKKDKCKDIYHLGVGLLGNPDVAFGFVVGWIVKTIKDATEKEQNSKWIINHTEEEISDGEFKSNVIKSLRQLADRIETDEDFDSKKAPIVRGDTSGTDLF